MKIIKNKKIFILVIALGIFLLLGMTGITYAYFQAIIIGEGTRNVIVSGDLQLDFLDSLFISTNSIFPGDSMNKAFSVENHSDRGMYYEIGWEELNNTFVNNEIHVSLTCQEYDISVSGSPSLVGLCSGTSDAPVRTINELIKDNTFIQSNRRHTYQLQLHL